MPTDTFKTGSGIQYWDVAANWSTGSIPQPGDDVVLTLPAGSSDTVEIAATDPAYTVGSLTITGQQSATFPFGLTVAGSLTVTGPTAISAEGQLEVYNNGGALLQGTTTLGNYGSIQVGGTLPGSVTIDSLNGLGNDHLFASNGTATVLVATGSTSFSVQTGARLTVGQTSGSDFFGLNGGTLSIGDTATALADTLDSAGGKVSTLDLTQVAYQPGETAQVTLVSDQVFPIYSVTLRSVSGQTVYTIDSLEGPINASTAPSVIVGSDMAGGTLVSIACFTAGTMIRMKDFDRAAGELAIGDEVMTLSGEAKPIIWIGRRSYAGRFLARQPHLLPIRVQAGALGDGLPRHDLLVSPCHAMFLDGILVPASSLVNGTTICQEAHADRVDYVHVELAEHDVIYAEGAPSETFIDDDSRNAFHNAAEYRALYGNASSPAPRFCAPRMMGGYAVEAIRARLTPGNDPRVRVA